MFSSGSLEAALRSIEQFLCHLRLRLHAAKSRLYRTACGIGFLGWRIFRDHRRLVRTNMVRFRRRLRALQQRYASGTIGWREAAAHLQAWNAHAAHGDTWRLRGFAGVLYAAGNQQGNPNAGVAYELDAIAAVVIGGTPLTGGRGSISGTIVGTLIMGVLTNMLRLNNVDSNVEMMIKAVIIVLAVAVQQRQGS